MKPKLILGIFSIVLFTSLLMYNFGNSISTYVDFEQAEDREVSHVVGVWERSESHGFSRETMQFSFHMKDESGNVRRVVYPRPKPNNFEQATQLVVVGTMRNNVFHADDMLMKCPSKYNENPDFEPADHSTPAEVTEKSY
jgi:cytochrome c-type biogenesis protein CcmE